MKLLLTSGGVTNQSILDALVDLLGKPVGESRALVVPTAIYPFAGGTSGAHRAVTGQGASPLAGLGWASLGILELTALPSIPREAWVPELESTDALLVWGGNVAYLAYWMRQSSLADLLPRLENLVYVGVSAGSIVTTPFNGDAESNRRIFPKDSPVVERAEEGLGLVDATMWVHVGHPDPIFADHTMANVEQWAAGRPVTTYALDDQSALKVTDDPEHPGSPRRIEVVSEGIWKMFPAGPSAG